MVERGLKFGNSMARSFLLVLLISSRLFAADGACEGELSGSPAAILETVPPLTTPLAQSIQQKWETISRNRPLKPADYQVLVEIDNLKPVKLGMFSTSDLAGDLNKFAAGDRDDFFD